jgi:hypothetical protein
LLGVVGFFNKFPAILHHYLQHESHQLSSQVQFTLDTMSHSSCQCSDSASDNSCSNWQQCNLTLRYTYISHVIIAATQWATAAVSVVTVLLTTAVQTDSSLTWPYGTLTSVTWL